MVVDRISIKTNIRGICDRVYDIAWLEPLLPENCELLNYKQKGNNSNTGFTTIVFNKKDRARVHGIISSFNMDLFTTYSSVSDPNLMCARLSSRGEIILYNGDLVSADRVMPFSKRKVLKIIPQCLKEFYTVNNIKYDSKDISIQENYMNVTFKILCKNLDTAKWLLNSWYSTFNRKGGDYVQISHCLSNTVEYLDTTECVVTGILLHREPNYREERLFGVRVIKGIRSLNTFLK